MYYRRKVLLSLLQMFEGTLEKIQLQKLLFLFCQKQEKPAFHFIPFKYGCFSFQANADLGTLGKYGLIDEQEKSWKINAKEDFLKTLNKQDALLMRGIALVYKTKSTDDLIKLTYQKYPYYAINSQIAGKILGNEELMKVTKSRPGSEKICLYTIGYEGISLEEYINQLIQKDIKVLCDVRKNSFSMKYGFSKSQLQAACEGVGIKFLHFPEVGIESSQRQELNNQDDYDQLFASYCREVLPQTLKTQEAILALVEEHQRVALTCFEGQHCQCHRSHLATAVAQLPNFKYAVEHL
jgi:uncharacterized protein (DUF488 family)